MNKKILIFFSLCLFIFSAGGSYALFSQYSGGQSSLVTKGTDPALKAKINNDYEALEFDPNVPKTEMCPLTGVKYGSDQKAWWESHRPLGVMIENHFDARPQSGINAADVTYEAVAEGGITRTMDVYYCQDAGIIGPDRSARTYFLDYISEYGDYPLYAHVGGANTPGPANALGQIDDYGWGQYNDLSQFSIGFPTFKRDQSRLGHDVATEHTMYSSTTKLWDVAKQRGLTNVDKNGKAWDANFIPYKFATTPDAGSRPSSQVITIPWDDADYSVVWTYNSKDDLYYRKNGGQPHMDRNTNKQLTTSNIIVLFEKESHAQDGYEGNAHMLYGTTGSGEALVFKDGKEIKAKWKKPERTDRTILTDTNGDEIQFTPGKLWFEIQGISSSVTVQ
jgi:hypothetical protein